MASVRNISGQDLQVPWLGGRLVQADDVVDVPDDDYDAYVCQPTTWEGVDEPANILRGEALEQALKDAGLPRSGTADEKRARLAEHNDSQEG